MCGCDVWLFPECDSVMLARSAQWNPSVFRSEFNSTHAMSRYLWNGAVVFRKEGPLPLTEVIKDYIRLAIECNNNTSNTKYCVAQMLQSAMEGKDGKALLAATNMREIW